MKAEQLLTNQYAWIREVGQLFLSNLRYSSRLLIMGIHSDPSRYASDLLYLYNRGPKWEPSWVLAPESSQRETYILQWDDHFIYLYINQDYLCSFTSVQGVLDYLITRKNFRDEM